MADGTDCQFCRDVLQVSPLHESKTGGLIMRFLSRVSFAIFFAAILPITAAANEPVTLIRTIVKWRYPDAKIGKSQMSDAATVDANGKRTVPSTMLKTTLTTTDPVDKVLAFYRELLARDSTKDDNLGIGRQSGRSVVFSDESDGRPFAFHTIVVNAPDASTILIITRGKDEQNTHIAWKRYLKHDIDR
jgi:hypothetical protein